MVQVRLVMGLQSPLFARMKRGPGICADQARGHANTAATATAAAACIRTGAGGQLMMVEVMVLHVLHFARIRCGPWRGRVIAAAQRHVQVPGRGARHVCGRSHAGHCSRATV